MSQQGIEPVISFTGARDYARSAVASWTRGLPSSEEKRPERTKKCAKNLPNLIRWRQKYILFTSKPTKVQIHLKISNFAFIVKNAFEEFSLGFFGSQFWEQFYATVQ